MKEKKKRGCSKQNGIYIEVGYASGIAGQVSVKKRITGFRIASDLYASMGYFSPSNLDTVYILVYFDH